MPRYRRLGEQIEQSERDFLVWSVRPASTVLLACTDMLYRGQANGFPDISGKRVLSHAQNGLDIMDEAQPQLADGRLREMCVLLRKKAAEMLRLDAEAVEFIAGYLGRQPLDRTKLQRYIESSEFAGDYPSGPAWAAAPGYLSLRRRSLAIFDAAWLLDRQIAERIRELVEAQGEVFEDAAAHSAPIPRPVDQLRGRIEAIRDEIKDIGALSERLTESVTRPPADLSSDTDKDTTSP